MEATNLNEPRKRMPDEWGDVEDIRSLPSEELLWVLYGGAYTFEGTAFDDFFAYYLDAYAREYSHLSSEAALDAANARASQVNAELEVSR